jgi:thymidylate synthase
MYKPYAERVSDRQYTDLLRRIADEGEFTKNPFQTHGTFTHLSLPPLVYRFENGFPVLTERPVNFWRKPIAEMIAFIHGARTLADLERLGGKSWASWWRNWVTPEKCEDFCLPPGDLGGGSYGPVLHDLPAPDGGTFNQFEHLLKQIKEQPALRTHVITTWYAPLMLQHKQLVRDVVVAPCHGTVIKVTIIGGRLTLTHVQRSADMPIGVPSNIIQYAALTLMLAQVLGVQAYQYVHYLPDGHIYENQMDGARELMERPSAPFPTMRIIDPEITDLFAFRPEHFELSDYYPGPKLVHDLPATV